MTAKPKIFVITRGRMGLEVIGGALAEDGHGLGGHWSTNRCYLRHDMGITSDWHHEDYNKHYPDGYELVDLIDVDDLSTVPEYMAALEKNRVLYEQEQATGKAEDQDTAAGRPA